MKMYQALGSSRLTQACHSTVGTCKRCGKRFSRTTEYAFGDYCGWSCIQASRQEDGRKKRKQPVKDEHTLFARIELCKKKIAYYEHIAKDMTRSADKRNGARKNMSAWVCKLQDAEVELGTIRRADGKSSS